MGEVYRARDTKLGRAVALKVLPEAFAFDPDRVARFEREAKVLASLNHPHIAVLHGMEQSAGWNFLVMELVEGETLAERLAGSDGRQAVPFLSTKHWPSPGRSATPSRRRTRPIPGTENPQGVAAPVFSPDGQSIAFWSASDQTLKLIPAAGGAALTICRADNPFGMGWGWLHWPTATGSRSW